MANSTVYKHYLRALRYWPKDLLRPHVSFQERMRHRVDARFLGKDQQSPEGARDSSAGAGPKVSDGAEMEQVNALYSLLENRYSQKYPLSKAFMEPTSNPNHYYDLMAELEEAPKRGWWARTLNKWKGKVRWK